MPSVATTRLAAIPEGLKQPCAPLADLPDRALSKGDMTRALGQTRSSYGDCSRRQAALAAATTKLENQGE
jgi:hypothetical protein